MVTPERGALPAQSDQFIAVWRVDDHELVCTRRLAYPVLCALVARRL